MKIHDGKGKGNEAHVDGNNRLHVQATVETEAVHSAEIGDAYNINTGLISVTADATLLYFKNDSLQDFVVETIALGSSTGITHSASPYITVIRNVTAGDIISDATAVSMNQNRNFGSTKTLSSTVYKGKVGGTATGGSDVAILQVTPGGRSFYALDFILPKGTSLTIALTANVSSGSANYYAALIGHLKDTESF
jgi:hypothetical protein